MSTNHKPDPLDPKSYAGAKTVASVRQHGKWVETPSDPYGRCTVLVSDKEKKSTRRDARRLLAHESDSLFPDGGARVRRFNRTGATWLVEGSAEWASYEYAGIWSETANIWNSYTANPEKSLYDRGYNAIGFFYTLTAERSARGECW